MINILDITLGQIAYGSTYVEAQLHWFPLEMLRDAV